MPKTLTSKGLQFEIACIENTIRLKLEVGEDVTFEQEILKSYKRYLKRLDKLCISKVKKGG